ncbi:MAG: hypothetical protein K0R52_771 [Alphaproteobacteria bacterium]|nr:hypothetical protein [Alphaproteobacteria bacterium]
MGVIYLEFNKLLSKRRGISNETVENSRCGGEESQKFKTNRHANHLLQDKERLEETNKPPNIFKNSPPGNTSTLSGQPGNLGKKSFRNIFFLPNRKG